LPEAGRLPVALPEAARRLLEHAELPALFSFAAAEGASLYLAGGAVRDLLLGRDVYDLDLVCRSATDFARRFAQARSLPFVMLDEQHGVARVVAPGLDLDFSDFRARGATPEDDIRADLRADLMERDFTVNSIALPLEALIQGRLAPLIDPAGGQADLARRTLRATLPRSLADDPLRALRLYRFAAQLGFEPEPATKEAAWAEGPRLSGVAGERIRAELVKLLGVPCAAQLREMAESGLLGAVLTGVEEMRGVSQRGYHHLDVLGHGLLTAERLEEVALEPAAWFPCPEETHALSACGPLWLIKLAALMHDIGKPQAAAEGDDHVSFHRHEEFGAQIARINAERLRLSRAEADRLVRLISLHMRPFHLVRLARLGELTERGVRRMLDAAGDDLGGMFLIAMADSLAASGPDKPANAEALLADLFCQAARYLRERLRPMRERPRLVTGDDLIETFGLEPGPKIGELLAAIEDAYIEDEIKSREEALALAARLLKD
jgi:poly(A) polymerase